MSTIKTVNLQHPSSPSNNIVLDNAGNATVAGTLTATNVSGNGSGLTGITGTITPTTGATPYYGARAWVNFNGTGTVTIRSSGNVSSITDNNTGDYTLNFGTAMPDENYAFTTGIRKDEASVGTTTGALIGWNSSTYSTTQLRLICRLVNDAIGGNFDVITACVAIHR